MFKAFTIAIAFSFGLASSFVLASNTSTSGFSYQGHLKQNGQPVNDTVDFLFRLFDAPTGGNQIGSPLNVLDAEIVDGLFTVELDFGAEVFDGSERWLDIRVSGTQLSPRQKITASPYAIHSLNANGSDGGSPTGPAGGDLSGEYPNPLIAANAVDSSKLATDVTSVAKISADTIRVQLHATSPDIVAGHPDNFMQSDFGNVIAGGGSAADPNRMLNGADYCVIAGGVGNAIDTSARAVISGGFKNELQGHYSTIGGGDRNSIIDDSENATIGGGSQNEISWPGQYATIGGGYNNQASGEYTTIPGGQWNTASGYGSFAAGSEAKATHAGSFVWSDHASGNLVTSTAAHQWTARATGGVRFFTNNNLTSGVQVGPGGNSWSSISDRNAKENFDPVDVVDVLERLAAVPITTWNYKSEDPSIRRMGPMAQDFWPAFGLGDDEMRISNIDADGVAFAAIQGLYDLLQERDDVIEAQHKEIDALRDRLESLEALVHSMTNTPEGESR